MSDGSAASDEPQARSLSVAALAGGGALLLLAAASAVSTSRFVAPRLGLDPWSVEAAYSLAAPLAVVLFPLVLRRRRRAGAWPFREGVVWTAPGALPLAALVAGAGVGSYTGYFQHLHVGGASWSIGVGLALLAPLCLLLLAGALLTEAGGPVWRGALGVLLFGGAFELCVTAGLHLGSRPQELSLSLPTIALVHLGWMAVLIAAAARRLRACAPGGRARTAARLAGGLVLAGATSCASSSLLAGHFGFVARRSRALAAKVEAEVLPFVRGELPGLLPATWDDQGWTPARRAALERAVGRGTVATSVGAGDEERLEDVLETDGTRPHALPLRLLELVIEAPARRGERRVLAWYTAYGNAFRRERGLLEGAVGGFGFTSRERVSSLPQHLTVRGQLTGPDGTPFAVTVLWEDDPLLRPKGGPALDELLPR